MPAARESLENFAAWSIPHFGAIAALVVVALSLSLVRRRVRDETAARRMDVLLAAIVAIVWVVIQSAQLMSEQFAAGTSLPLHVSDLTLAAVAVALCTRWRWARATVYYWGLALGSLAFVIPDLRDGPARLGFYLFWGGHISITSGVVYELIGRRYRPRWRDWRLAAAVSVIYAAMIVPFNAVTGHSYGYLGPDQANQPAVIHYFGAWPWRAVPIVLAGLAAMALLTVAWEPFRKPRREVAAIALPVE